VAEVTAARAAGLSVVAVSRAGSPLDLPADVPQVSTFEAIPSALQPTP
jgi:precorrin-6x reductase